MEMILVSSDQDLQRVNDFSAFCPVTKARRSGVPGRMEGDTAGISDPN